MTDSAKKTCKMCSMEIPAQAKKCPYCQHFQNRIFTIMFHPAFAVVFAIVPMLLIGFFFSKLFDNGEDYQRYSGQIEITDSKIIFGATSNGATVGVMGTIKNHSPIPWKEIHFQVDFQDANEQRVDTAQKEDYPFVLPASDSLSFKVSFRREFPETNYVHHTVRVVSAKDARTRW
jgi:hypothetical protein